MASLTNAVDHANTIQETKVTMDVLSLITARGGSKGLSRKNIREVGGKPLIAWTIQSALASRCSTRVIVSTDDPEIAAVSKAYGAVVPFLRPAHLAGDNSPHIAVVEHAISWLAGEGKACPDFILLLQPTSPLRTPEDIRAAIRIARDKRANSVVSVSELHPHPRLATTLTPDGTLVDYDAPASYIRRQDLPMWDLHLADLILRNRCEGCGADEQSQASTPSSPFVNGD